MTPLEVLLQLGTVFLGAFSAFWLENLRERRQLRAWANECLRRIRSDLSTAEGTQAISNLEKTLHDHATLLSFSKDHVPSEDEWNSLMMFSFTMHTDHRALLEGSAVRVLPAELVKTLAERDERMRADETMANFCAAAWQQYTVPLALRRTPPDETERRGLEVVQEIFRAWLGYALERRKAEARVLDLLDRYNLGR